MLSSASPKKTTALVTSGGLRRYDVLDMTIDQLSWNNDSGH
jgi:hypothetical protein